MAAAAKKGAKPVFKSALPYSQTQWPSLTSVQRADVMDLLCSLLQPLGDHRRTHVTPSKGKKRKRDAQKDSKTANNEPPETPPPPPDIHKHILVGLNSVTRHLEALAALTAPPSAPSHGKGEPSSPEATPPRPLAMVLIPHNHPPSSLPHAHIPALIHLSTINTPTDKRTRLVAVPPNCESTIAEALHIPHVGALGIMEDAPGADALVAYVRENVDVTSCAWIDEAMAADWKGVKIEMQQN